MASTKTFPRTLSTFNTDLNKIALFRDAVRITDQPCTPDLDNGLILRNYMQNIRTFIFYYNEDTNNITPKEFAHGYAIYAIDRFDCRQGSKCCSSEVEYL